MRLNHSLVLCCLLSGALASPSWAYDSPMQQQSTIHFSDYFDAYQNLEWDTGWLPGGSPAQFRFYTDSSGGTFVDMDATSDLDWPEAINHTLYGVPGSGLFKVLFDLTAAAQIRIFLPDYGIDQQFDIWSENYSLGTQQGFDPFLLPNPSPQTISLAQNGAPIESFTYPLELFDTVVTVSLVFHLNIFPQVTGDLTGVRIDTEATTGLYTIDQEGGSEVIQLPIPRQGELELASSYVADISTQFAIIVRPSADVCIEVLGLYSDCFEVVAFDIPIPLGGFDGTRVFDPVEYSHALPVLDILPYVHDFGPVALGNISNFFLPVGNLVGLQELVGTAAIDGDSDFQMWPNSVLASPGTTDGIVVSFSPSILGEHTAEMLLETSDPGWPEVRVALKGEGWDPYIPPPPLPPGEAVESQTTASGCQCNAEGSAAATSLGSSAWFLALLLPLLRRRRS